MADQFNILDRQLYVPKGARFTPTGVVATTFARGNMGNNTALVSGQQTLQLVYLEAGDLVSGIAFYSSTQAAVTPTNQWFSLYSPSLAKLAVTADDTTTAWAANTRKQLAIASPYLIPASGQYYVGCQVVAGTTPSLQTTGSSSAVLGRPPIACGRDTTNTGLTDPASAPATATLVGALAFMVYAEVL